MYLWFVVLFNTITIVFGDCDSANGEETIVLYTHVGCAEEDLIYPKEYTRQDGTTDPDSLIPYCQMRTCKKDESRTIGPLLRSNK